MKSNRRSRKKQKRKSSLIQMELDDNDLSDVETDETFNPFKNVEWKFLNSEVTRAPSRQDLLRYPSQILTDPKYQDEEAYNFKLWKEDFMCTLDNASNTTQSQKSHPFNQSTSTLLERRSTNPSSMTQILFINEDNEEQQETLRTFQAPLFDTESIKINQIPLSEDEILRQTEEYLLTLNRIECNAKNTNDRSKSADYFRKQQLEQNKYLANRDRLSHIPSTEQLLQNVNDFELECIGGGKGGNWTKSKNGSKKSQFDDDDEWNNSRSPSPVIIWRPSSRITIARNLPPNLRSTYDQKRTKLHDLIEQTVSCLELQGVKQEDEESVDNLKNNLWKNEEKQSKKKEQMKISEWNSNKRTFPPRIEYGKWYIPTKKWKVRRKGEVIEYENKKDIDPKLEEQANDLKETIPDLFISKKYKLYILNQKDQNQRNLPEYLSNVDVNEKD